MTLIVEDGTGLATAESYASVAEADAYFDKFGRPDVWKDAAPDRKELALRKGTQYLDAKYPTPYGTSANSAQALNFPRTNVVDESGHEVPSSPLPAKLKQATYVAALEWLQRQADGEGELLPTLESSGSISKEKISLGGGAIVEEFEYASPKGQTIELPLVDGLMADFVGSGAEISLWRG